MLTDPLRAAYLAAIYRFGTGPLIQLRVGKKSDALHAWLQQGRHRSATVLTAFNPGSRHCSEEFNASAQQQLRSLVQAYGLPFLEGQNLDPAGAWPAEHSLLIADLALAGSRELALQFEQLAFLWSDATAIPQLHATDPGQP